MPASQTINSQIYVVQKGCVLMLPLPALKIRQSFTYKKTTQPVASNNRTKNGPRATCLGDTRVQQCSLPRNTRSRSILLVHPRETGRSHGQSSDTAILPNREHGYPEPLRALPFAMHIPNQNVWTPKRQAPAVSIVSSAVTKQPCHASHVNQRTLRGLARGVIAIAVCYW